MMLLNASCEEFKFPTWKPFTPSQQLLKLTKIEDLTDYNSVERELIHTEISEDENDGKN